MVILMLVITLGMADTEDYLKDLQVQSSTEKDLVTCMDDAAIFELAN